MKHSQKISVQLLAEILAQNEIYDIVISPGSRNAALTIEFTNDKRFTTYSIVDERSAAFFALGISKKVKKPVTICCTSGSAVANYYPAITEAFYANIPLLIISADRPENFVDNFDGQTIRQHNIFELHSAGNFQLTENEDEKSILRNEKLICEALQICIEKSSPVHINFPFSEPLYEQTFDSLVLPKNYIIKPLNTEFQINKVLFSIWNATPRKMILCGMLPKDIELQQLLSTFSADNSLVILTETTSNLYYDNFFPTIDKLLFTFDDDFLQKFQPELLLTIGQNVVSKKVKDFLRKSKLKHHWHLDEFWQPNTYFQLTEKLNYDKKYFLKELVKNSKKINSDYFQDWKNLEKHKKNHHYEYLQKIGFSDLKVFEFLSENIAENTCIHFSNSSVIRYSQLFDFNSKFEIHCNRGTSGIDGCTSTFLGFAMKNHLQKSLFITGDISFFYDSNALWNNYIPNNCKIILLNNGGGNIFRIIPGPDSTEALEQYFETKHKRNAKFLSEMYHFNYYYVNDLQYLEPEFFAFDEANSPSILEIDTSKIDNATILRKYFLYL